MDDQEPTWPYWAALLLCIAAGLWFARDYISPLVSRLSGGQPVLVDELPSPQQPSGPRYPLPSSTSSVATGSDNAAELADPLPALAESDPFFRNILAQVFGPDIDSLLATDGLVSRFVATIDSIPARQIPRRIWPINSRLEDFRVTPAATAGEFYPATENSARYNLLVDLVTGVDAATFAAMYTRVYPLLQEAYAGLGYPDAYFNDRLVGVIDHLLTTPAPAEPILLVRPHVLYQYADPELEALSGGQKMLIRMGSENAAKLKAQLRALRSELVREPSLSAATRSGCSDQ